MARRKQYSELVQGRATHRRTEGDYMGVLLESVTLDDWRAVINSAKALAKGGDPQARAWLAQYLMGKPVGSAPTPLTVVVAQLNGVDPLVSKLAAPAIHRHKYPPTRGNDDIEGRIRALVAAELVEKIKPVETIENAAAARAAEDLKAE